MKKVLMVIAGILFLTSWMSPLSMAEERKVSEYQNAVENGLKNNRSLQKLELDKENARIQYEQAVKDAADIQIDGITVSFGGQQKFISFNDYTKVQMRKKKELYPSQMKMMLDLADDRILTTKNSLTVSLRQLLGLLFIQQKEIKIKERRLQLAYQIDQQNAVKLQKGIITQEEKDDSAYSYYQAMKDAGTAKRTVTGTERQISSITGMDLKTTYSDVNLSENLDKTRLKDLNTYIAAALKNRLEIKSIEQQLELKNIQKGYLEDKDLYLKDDSAAQEYISLLSDIENTNIQLNKQQKEVEIGIKNAYATVNKAYNDVSKTVNARKLLSSNYNTLLARYKAGYVSKNMVDQVKIDLDEMDLNYKVAVFNWNTQVQKLENAAGIGPAF